MSKTDRDTAWPTSHEIAFLRGLGSHSACPMPRAKLLAGYLAGAQRRTAWPKECDKIKVLAFCQVQLLEAP